MPTKTQATPADPALLRIQDVAAETGLTPRAIRYYEEIGLLEPAARSDGAYRLFDARGPRAPALHPLPARRRRVLASPRSASCSRTRRRGSATASTSARPATRPSAAPCSATPSSASTARSRPSKRKTRPPRRDDRRRPRAAATTSTSTSPTSTAGPTRTRAGRRTTAQGPSPVTGPSAPSLRAGLVADQGVDARSATATTGCSSAVRRSRLSGPGCSRSPRRGSC